MRFFRLFPVLLIAVGAVAAFSVDVVARPYAFRTIADNSGPHLSFHAPAINNSRTVVWYGDVNEDERAVSIAGPGVPATIIADSNGQFDYFRAIAINNAGVVAFGSTLDNDYSAISTRSAAGPIVTLDNTIGPWLGDINDVGMITYHGYSGDGLNSESVFVRNGSTTTTIADTSGPFGGFQPATYLVFAPPMINNAGTAVFWAQLDTGEEGVYKFHGGSIDTVAETERNGPYYNYRLPRINDSGTIAYIAYRSFAGTEIHVVEDAAAGATPVIFATTDGTRFKRFTNLAMNHSGQIVFAAERDGNSSSPLPSGIYAGPDPTADKVIDRNDPLFGSTITSISFSEHGLNDLGDIAFGYVLADGRTGVAIASLAVPGDADLDGDVDLSDLGTLATFFDHTNSSLDWTNGDFDDDNDVDLNDLGTMASNFAAGRAQALAEFQAMVPEPTALSFVPVGLLFLKLRTSSSRRHRADHDRTGSGGI